jgi:hypothetical protein
MWLDNLRYIHIWIIDKGCPILQSILAIRNCSTWLRNPVFGVDVSQYEIFITHTVILKQTLFKCLWKLAGSIWQLQPVQYPKIWIKIWYNKLYQSSSDQPHTPSGWSWCFWCFLVSIPPNHSPIMVWPVGCGGIGRWLYSIYSNK